MLALVEEAVPTTVPVISSTEGPVGGECPIDCGLPENGIRYVEHS